MVINDFKDFPKRVWINNPSTLQPYHEYHGAVGIGVYKLHSTGHEEITIYFPFGKLKSLVIDPKYLDLTD